MVNGSSMLSSTPSSLLLSTALPSVNTASGAGGEEPAASPTTGFAELLNDLSRKAGGTAMSKALPADSADSIDPKLASGAAIAAEAATASGKILPVALPEAAEAETAETPDAATGEPTDIDIDPATALLLAGLAQLRLGGAEKRQTASADVARAALPQGAMPAATAKLAGKADPAQAKGAAPAATVAITVATQAEAAPTAPEIAARVSAKAQSAETPLQPVLPGPPAIATTVDAAPAQATAATAATPIATAPAAMPSAADINAALDRLVAAREALMPAEAALAVEHSEFGEISIRFEQGSDGRLSAELRAADPELQRAVTAAAGADRGLAMGADADGGRPTNLAHQRGAAAGGESGSGERSQPGQERETNQRRGAGRSAGHEGTNDPRPGVFA